jgi:hypothetical protein
MYTELDQALVSLQLRAAVHLDQVAKAEPFAIREGGFFYFLICSGR